MKRAFLSYAREDAVLKNRVLFAMQQLQNDGLVSIWHDVQGREGPFAEQIDQQIDESDFFMPLISPSFVESDYCKKELRRAGERAKEGKCKILPILLIETGSWTDIPIDSNDTLLGKFNALPFGRGPVAQATPGDDKYGQVASDFRAILSTEKPDLAAVEKAFFLELSSLVFNSLYWCLETDSWMHTYDEDIEADRDLPGYLRIKVSVDQIVLHGTDDDDTRVETEAFIDWDRDQNCFIYKEHSKEGLRTLYAFTLKTTERGRPYFQGETFDDKFGPAPAQCAPKDILIFLRNAFREQHRKYRRQRTGARRGKS